jgi:two-component system sensor histidine kinase UhpB
VLTELGLKATMEDLLYHWAVRNPELKLTLECSNAVDGLEQKIAIQVFRVIQECLTNIVRHARATQAQITMAVNPNTHTLHLQVSDNGQGCNIAQTKHGFGLLGMKERIKSLGGNLSFHTGPHQGMRVIASIPLSRKP